MYRYRDIILCCGQGAWEDEMIYSTSRMKELLDYKDIPAWIDFWGNDVNHDWDWWQIQLPYFLNHIL
jgi:esterase/lipase superfamily enzyme